VRIFNKFRGTKGFISTWERFGCNKLEATVYLNLLESGGATVQEVAKQVRKNRVTVHSAIERLIEKGFLFETRKNKRRTIVAESPDVLRRLIQKSENELKLLKSQVGQAEELLAQFVQRSESRPTVKFYEGVEGFKRMLEESLTARREVLVFIYVDTFSQVLGPDYLEDYFARRAKLGIHTRLIFPPCPFVHKVAKKSQEYNIEARLLPPELVWQSGVFSWNDVMAIMSLTSGKFTCTIIQNEDIASFYQNIIFELCWGRAERISS